MADDFEHDAMKARKVAEGHRHHASASEARTRGSGGRPPGKILRTMAKAAEGRRAARAVSWPCQTCG
jgi:hypothetical protein